MSNGTAKVIGVSFIIGMLLIGMFLVKSKQEQKSLRIVGYASKQFVSDMVKWNLTVQKPTELNGLSGAYKSLSTDMQAFKDFLIGKGIPEKDISLLPITSNPMYDNYGHVTSYTLNQRVIVISTQIDNIEKLALSPDFFAEKGLLLDNSNLSYLYTKLPDLKKKLLSEATADALERAKEVSNAAKVRLGKMSKASAGVFQITEPYSTDVSDYGIYNTSTRNKSISVTITTLFGLK